MPECLELGDEASGLAFGVAAAEVVAAEVACRLSGHAPRSQLHGILACSSQKSVQLTSNLYRWHREQLGGFDEPREPSAADLSG